MNTAVDHALYGAVRVECHMLGVNYIFKLTQVCHITVREDIGLKVPVNDILLVFHAVKPESADVL